MFSAQVRNTLPTPGTTVIPAGSNRATNREVDDETIRRAAAGRIVTDNVEGAQFESGDLIAAANRSVISWGQVIEIGHIAAGKMSGRSSADEINMFVSQGVGIEDVALGGEIYRRAKAQGIGREFQDEADFKTYLNPASLEILKDCRVEPGLADAKSGDRFQFERLGYFCVDPDSSPGRPVFNRTVTLRDTWAKIQKSPQKK